MINDNTKMAKILELSDDDFDAIMIKILQPAIRNTLETSEKIQGLSKGIENICNVRDNIKKKQMKF